MTSFYEKVSIDVFEKLNIVHCDYEVSVSFTEVAGETCYDLFNHFAQVDLLQVRDGGYQPYPTVEPIVQSQRELLSLIRYGCEVRSTAATGVHDASSRSHAVLKIYIRLFSDKNKDTKKSYSEGVLCLVDLAGHIFFR
jgi:kinesin family protein 2/24